jgi:hypothetical protein
MDTILAYLLLDLAVEGSKHYQVVLEPLSGRQISLRDGSQILLVGRYETSVLENSLHYGMVDSGFAVGFA